MVTVEFNVDEILLLQDVLLNRIDSGGSLTRMRQYIELFDKFSDKLYEENEE